MRDYETITEEYEQSCFFLCVSHTDLPIKTTCNYLLKLLLITFFGVFPLFLSSLSLSLHPFCFHGNLPVDAEGEKEVKGQEDQSHSACSDWSCGRIGRPATYWNDPSPLRTPCVLLLNTSQTPHYLNDETTNLFRHCFIVLSLIYQHPFGPEKYNLIKKCCFGNAVGANTADL